MTFRTFAVLAAAALSLTALAPAPAEAYDHGYRYRSGGDYEYRGGYRYRGRSDVAGPLYETQTPYGVVRERQYGDCYVRNVTTYDAYGRRIVRRTKYC